MKYQFMWGYLTIKKKWLGKVWKRVKIEHLVYEKKMKYSKETKQKAIH